MKHFNTLFNKSCRFILIGVIFFIAGLSNLHAQNSWTQKSDIGFNTPNADPSARYAAVGFSIGSKGYIGTGYDGSYRKDFWEYDPATDMWTQKADFGGSARNAATGFSVGTKGYIGTGFDGVNLLKDFWQYDPALNTWVQKADFAGSPRDYAIGFGLADRGYLGTGNNGTSEANDFWGYDPATNVWVQRAGFAGGKRMAAVGFTIGDKGYAGTGAVNNNPHNDFWEFDPAANTWTQKLAYPGSGRIHATGFTIGTKGYIGTGHGYGGDKSDFWEFDPASNTWTEKTDVAKREQAVGFSINGKGYLGTGIFQVLKKDFLEFDPALNTWTNKADFGGVTRTGAVAFTIGNKGYAGTGLDLETYKKDFWEYDPATDAWTQKTNFPGGGRYHAVGFSIGNKGYVGTGINESYPTPFTYYQDFWEYDPASNSWTQKADFGGGIRFSAVGFSIGNKGYLGTGSDSTNIFYKDFWEYDPLSDTWIQKADFGGTARSGATGFSIGNSGYIGTGRDFTYNYKKDFWQYDPSANSWSQKADFGGAERFEATGFSIGSKGYLGTGGLIYAPKTDFWEYDPATNVWMQKSDFAGGYCMGSLSFSIGNKGYVGTGGDDDFWEYTPDSSCIGPDVPIITASANLICPDSLVVLNITSGNLNSATNWMWYSGGCGVNTEGSGTSLSASPAATTTYYVRGEGGCYNSWACSSITIEVKMEICNGLDDNCNGIADDGLLFVNYYADLDQDSYGDPNSGISTCSIVTGYVMDNTDCNDTNAFVNPAAIEVCDSIDNNCDGNIDEGLLMLSYADADSDGYGNANNPALACTMPTGFVSDSTDCDDTNATANPASPEIPNNGIDDNCNGYTDEFGTGTDYVYSESSFFSISPNPNIGITTLEAIFHQEEFLSVRILDLAGKELYSENIGKVSGNYVKQFDLFSFSAGTYLVQLIHNGQREVKKLIIVH